MITNIIAQLHTTLAYQSAVMQLMAGQANLDAQHLHLRETLPIVVPADKNEWSVAMPPDGVSGAITTSNYVYRFNAGRLTSIELRSLSRLHINTDTGAALLDTNAAYGLARQWLADLSVDVTALENSDSHTVQFAPPTTGTVNRERRRGREHGPAGRPATTNRIHAATARAPIPLFHVTWGKVTESTTARGVNRSMTKDVTVELLGSTRECVNVHIFNTALLTAPPLQVSNAAALLGPPPSPEHFVAEFLGGASAYDTVAHPEHVSAWLLSSPSDGTDTRPARSNAITLDTTSAAALSKTLTDFNSYSWLQEKACMPDYGVHLRFMRGADTVDMDWCFKCDHVQVSHNGRESDMDCDGARLTLVRILKGVFPQDATMANLPFVNTDPGR